MKVLYILSGTKLTDGSSKSFMNLLKGVVSSGVDAYVLCPNKEGLYNLLDTTEVGKSCMPYRATLVDDSKNLKARLRKLARAGLNTYSSIHLLLKCLFVIKPDIIHTNTSINDIGYRVAKLLKVPHVWHIREYGDLDFNIVTPHQPERLLAKRNYSITITKDIARHKGIYGSPNWLPIYNGVFSKNDLKFNPKKQNYILFAGRTEKKKGINDLVEAFIKYKLESPESEMVLKIAGSTDSKYGARNVENLKSRIAEAGISNQVEWLGNVREIENLMINAKATVVPSHFEGFGRVMAEAMFRGCLVIGKNTAGTKEQFDNGVELTGKEIGLRFDDVEELVKQLHYLDEIDEKTLTEFIKNGQEVVKKLYSVESNVEQVLSLYDKILASK